MAFFDSASVAGTLEAITHLLCVSVPIALDTGMEDTFPSSLVNNCDRCYAKEESIPRKNLADILDPSSQVMV